MLQKLRIFVIRWTISQFETYFFERKVSQFYKKIFQKKALSVIDVGANRGQTIDFFLQLNPLSVVHSFEPNPELHKALQKKYKSNNNINLIQMGVSNKVETKIFYENILDESSSFEELNLDSEYLKTKSSILGVKPDNIIKLSYPVEVTTLDHFFIDQQIQEVDVLKIDTEGHEYEGLEGLFESTRPIEVSVIQFEMHFDDMYLKNRSYKEIKDLLNSKGYFEIKRIKHGFGDFYDYFYSKDNDIRKSI